MSYLRMDGYTAVPIKPRSCLLSDAVPVPFRPLPPSYISIIVERAPTRPNSLAHCSSLSSFTYSPTDKPSTTTLLGWLVGQTRPHTLCSSARSPIHCDRSVNTYTHTCLLHNTITQRTTYHTYSPRGAEEWLPDIYLPAVLALPTHRIDSYCGTVLHLSVRRRRGPLQLALRRSSVVGFSCAPQKQPSRDSISTQVASYLHTSHIHPTYSTCSTYNYSFLLLSFSLVARSLARADRSLGSHNLDWVRGQPRKKENQKKELAGLLAALVWFKAR